MRRIAILMTVALLVPALASAKKRKKRNAPPPVGWHAEDGWPGQCFFPQDYEALGVGDRKIARSKAMTEIVNQWNGTRDDTVKMKGEHAMFFETVMLGDATIVEAVGKTNLEHCVKYMSAEPETRSLRAWAKWVKEEPYALTEGDCPHAPLVDTVFQYLDIDTGWQFKWGVCEGDTVTISGTTIDAFSLEKDGDFITLVGNGEKAIAEEYDCNLEGCFKGQLIMRFTGTNDVQTITPIGKEHTWTSPGHGFIEVKINDLTWGDNTWRQQGQLIDHAGITYAGK